MNSVTGAAPVTLACHPQTPSRVIQGIEVQVNVAAGDGVALAFALESDLSCLRIPASARSGRAADLWRHTCFEAFVMANEGPGYREFNFSPSGQWAAYAFRDYRDGGALDCELAPEIAVRRTANRLELDARIRRDFLPQGRPLRLGLSAVVEDLHGVLSYWALQHPAGKPDFHHSDSFAIPLVLP
jgi:hypothetical protein